MKKVMLMLMMLVVCGGCFAADKPEIKVGQVWSRNLGGDERKVFEVGAKYVVYGYKDESDKDYPSTRTRERFRRDYELVEQAGVLFEGNGDVWTFSVGGLKDPTQVKKKPYLHKNPTNDHWICSKHGDLDKNKKDGEIYISWSVTTIVREGYWVNYCHDCYWDVQISILDQHITGVKENE